MTVAVDKEFIEQCHSNHEGPNITEIWKIHYQILGEKNYHKLCLNF